MMNKNNLSSNKKQVAYVRTSAYGPKDDLKDCNNNINFDIDEIDEIVAVSLRRSLKDYSDGIKILLSVIGNKRQLNEDDRNKLFEALNAIRKDFNKLVVSNSAGNEKLTGSDGRGWSAGDHCEIYRKESVQFYSSGGRGYERGTLVSDDCG